MSNHAIVHVEFASPEPAGLGTFYHDLFGWESQTMPGFDYVGFRAPDGPGGGYAKADGSMVKPGDVVAYISTDDIDASLTKAEALGGKTLLPKTEVGSMGWMALFSDPAGNKVGLWTEAPQS